MLAGTWPSVRFLVFIDGSQSKRLHMTLGVLILNTHTPLLIDGSCVTPGSTVRDLGIYVDSD